MSQVAVVEVGCGCSVRFANGSYSLVDNGDVRAESVLGLRLVTWNQYCTTVENFGHDGVEAVKS